MYAGVATDFFKTALMYVMWYFTQTVAKLGLRHSRALVAAVLVVISWRS